MSNCPNTVRVKNILYLALSPTLVLILYIFLHETGHCIVAAACGARITEFSIVTAHMNFDGGNFSDFSSLWLHANGTVLPLCVVFVYMLVYRKNSVNSFYQLFSYMAVLSPIFSLLAWILLPLRYMISGTAPAGDDCTKFIKIFEKDHSPVLIIAAALLLFSVNILLMIKKQIIRNFFDTIKTQIIFA